jgi:hypothetical protein
MSVEPSQPGSCQVLHVYCCNVRPSCQQRRNDMKICAWHRFHQRSHTIYINCVDICAGLEQHLNDPCRLFHFAAVIRTTPHAICNVHFHCSPK